jgi:DNA-binding NarL/FixJ family response regulator
VKWSPGFHNSTTWPCATIDGWFADLPADLLYGTMISQDVTLGGELKQPEAQSSSMMNNILLADNQELFRIGIAKVLAESFRVAAQCADLERLMLSVDVYRSSIVLCFPLRPEYHDLMAQVKAAGSRAVVIAENSEPAHSFIAHDIRGVIYRNTTGKELVERVHRVIKGYWSIQRSGEATGSDEEDSIGVRVRDRLTPKEMQVVALLMQGGKNKEIALRLGIKEQVIKNYLRSIYDKTGVSGRLELAGFTTHNRILAAAAAEAGTLVWERR